jgi:hypothetical protein
MFAPLRRTAAFPRESSLKIHLGAFRSETYAGGPSPKKRLRMTAFRGFASDHELDE